MQAAVDPGGRAGRSEDVAVLDIEHIGVQFHPRIARCKCLRAGPVRGGRAPFQQTGLGQHEGAETQANHLRATRMGGNQRVEQGLRRPFLRVPPAGHDDRLRPFQGLQPVIDSDAKTRRGAQQPFLGRAHQQIERRHARMPVAEYQARHGEVKGADLVESDHRHRMTLHVGLPRNGLDGLAQS
ncbi:hypothetical protein D3C78_1081750 [compost metagenome]